MTENGSLLEWLNKLGITKELNNNDILSGITVNAALSKLIPNYTVHLPNANTASIRINNWNTVVNQLEKVGIKVGQQDKSKILNGDDKIVYHILYELKAQHDRSREEVEVDISKIDSRGDPKTAKSLLQLLILVIIKHFNFSIKEAVALLSNDGKYLAHILAKGFKENPKPVEDLLEQLMKLLPQIGNFCKNKQNETFFLKSIKPALISKFLSITEISLRILTQFTKHLADKVEIVKDELIATYVLSQRRHPCQVRAIVSSLTEILGYNKNLLSFIQAHSQSAETILLMIEFLNLGEENNQVSEVFSMFKFPEFVSKSIDQLKSSDDFINSATFLLRTIELNYLQLIQSSQLLGKMVQNLNLLTLSKRGDIIIYTNLVFSFLQLFGAKKNAIAPQFFKLAVDKYKSTLNEDQSHNYLLNFINIVHIFPSIPSASIVEAILFRFQTSTSFIGELQLKLIEISLEQMEEKGALRVYNIITKLFVQQVGRQESIGSILELIIKKFDSKIIFDLNVKFIKICLAIYYANIRKLNYSKSLVEGSVKLDHSNAFNKAKNLQIEKLLTNIILINDQSLNQAVEPLVCYTFFQSELKNKAESEGIKTVMLLFGQEEGLRKLYETDAKMLLEDSKNEGKKKEGKGSQTRFKQQSKARVSSDASLLTKKKDYFQNPPKVPLDAQKGLQKYTKVFKERVFKLSLEQEKKLLEQEKQEELRRKFTLKILQKGVKIAKDQAVSCFFEFGSKEKELQRDLVNDFSFLPFYDPEVEEDKDVKAVQYLIKKYNKLFKVYYNNYGGKLRPNTIKFFQEMSLTANLMQAANVWKLLRDHNLDLFITVKQVQYTIQKINASLKKEYKDSSLLDYEVFENFLVQAALIMFGRPPKDLRTRPLSDRIQLIVDKFREHAHENKIDEHLFDDIQNYQSNKSQQIRELNEKLALNPDYILPEGYKKITVKRVNFDYQLKFDSQPNLKQSCQDVVQVLDQILFENLGFHIIESYSSTFIEATARPVLYQTTYDHSTKERSMSSALPKISRVKQPAKEGEGEGVAVEEEQQKVQLGESKSPSNFQKLSNKFLKQKKLREQQKQRKLQQQEKRREQRDKQLKMLLEKHREKQQQSQKEKAERRRQEEQRQEEERKKKEKYQEELKKKVEEYTKKKEADKMKEEEERRKRKEEEQRNFQKMKQDIERKKKMVEESKLKKKQEEEEKLEKERAQKQRLEEENRQKLQEKKERTKQLIQQYKERKQKEEEQKLRSQQAEAEEQIVKSKVKVKSSTVKQAQMKQTSKPKAPAPEVKIQSLDNN